MNKVVSSFVPATGFDIFLPWYDLAVRLLARQTRMHENVSRIVSQRLQKLRFETSEESSGVHVVDVGCGSGTLLAGMRQRDDLNLTGIDVDARMLQQAKQKPGTDSINWIAAPSWETTLPAASAQVVTCTLLMHHLDDESKSRTLSEAFRISVPGGAIVLADFAHPASWLAWLRFQAVRVVDGRLNTAANLDGRLPEMLGAAGWQKVEEEFVLATPLGTVRGYTATKMSA
ncbi:MAG TPA: hypothetical protein DDW52_03630 [Planctomycetaceae bacterium]|nr:hypothetical protein [Planctomycetaceae bacterium]